MPEQLMVLQDIRDAVGDRAGWLMQSELVERIRDLARDATRYRWLVQERAELDCTRVIDQDSMGAPVLLLVAYKGPRSAEAVAAAIDADMADSGATSTVSAAQKGKP